MRRTWAEVTLSTRRRAPVVALAGLLLAGCGNAVAPSPGDQETTAATRGPTMTSATTMPTRTPTRTAPTASSTTAATGKVPTITTPTVVPPAGATSPERAIAAWMSRHGHRYAGDCAGTTLEEDVYKYCSTRYADRGDQQVYAIGPTFSEYTTWLLVERREGGWSVVAAAKLRGTDPPPW
jgi:hypothetical protein